MYACVGDSVRLSSQPKWFFIKKKKKKCSISFTNSINYCFLVIANDHDFLFFFFRLSHNTYQVPKLELLKPPASKFEMKKKIRNFSRGHLIHFEVIIRAALSAHLNFHSLQLRFFSVGNKRKFKISNHPSAPPSIESSSVKL